MHSAESIEQTLHPVIHRADTAPACAQWHTHEGESQMWEGHPGLAISRSLLLGTSHI